MNEQETPKPEMLKRHPLCQIWQEYDIEDMALDIAERGQDEPILRYEGMVLDGWHRYRGALKAGRIPTFEEFHGTPLEAAEKVHAANNVRRHMMPDQRYACFLKLCQQVPEFGSKYEAMKAEAERRIAAGQPLATGSQRLNVVMAKAAEAGVSPATAKKVERAVKSDPAALDRIARGATTANEELRKGKTVSTTNEPGRGTTEDRADQQPRKELVVSPGDLIYEVERVRGTPTIIEWQVKLVDTLSFECVGKAGRLHKVDAFTLEEAKEKRIKLLADDIAELNKELRGLKAEMKKEPIIVAAKRPATGAGPVHQQPPSPPPGHSPAVKEI
jgi:hypothetical protein